MRFRDEGYITSLRKYGENSVIITLASKSHGLIKGFVRGGFSKKNLGLYQMGNLINVDCYARLEENMLSFKPELIRSFVPDFMSNPQKTAALSAMCSLLNSCLPENENFEWFYKYIENFFTQSDWLVHYAFFEFYLLEYLGVGIDLSKCAVTSSVKNLAYVSPKTARAVCLEKGFPYRDRLFLYPHFIVDKNYTPEREKVADLLKMTGFFLNKNFFLVHDLKFPLNRANLMGILNL
ncbi:MAG: DNA repair protein RecO [Alphaproteobacteria bacterium]|nr:DNA repair protein RecO [Alphaproteobacteria bacterium]